MALSLIEKALETLVVLVADSNAYTRKLTRAMLINSGARAIYEVSDGVAALDSIELVNPDVLIMNWEMPTLNGPELLRIVRSPGVFPKPNLPIIILTDLGLRSRVEAAVRLGVHEILIRPISPSILQERLVSMVLAPRPMIHAGQHYIPMPHNRADLKCLLDEVAY